MGDAERKNGGSPGYVQDPYDDRFLAIEHRTDAIEGEQDRVRRSVAAVETEQIRVSQGHLVMSRELGLLLAASRELSEYLRESHGKLTSGVAVIGSRVDYLGDSIEELKGAVARALAKQRTAKVKKKARRQ